LIGIQEIDAFVDAWPTELAWLASACWTVAALVAMVHRSRADERSRVGWLALAVLCVLLAVEMPLCLRFKASGALRQLLKSAGPDYYAIRRPVQAAVIGACLVLAAGLAVWALRRAGHLSGACKLGLAGASVGVMGFLLELISLHYVDRHYSIYWSTWYFGILLIHLGLILGFARPSAPTGPLFFTGQKADKSPS